MSVAEECELHHLVSDEQHRHVTKENNLHVTAKLVSDSYASSPVMKPPQNVSRRPSSEQSHYSKASSFDISIQDESNIESRISRNTSVHPTGSSNTSAYANTSSGGHTGCSRVNPLTGTQDHKPPRPPQPNLSRLQNRKDVMDVRQMEQALIRLLEDFHSGKLRAFGKGCSMEQMTAIHEQQERLARLHFELGAQQELYVPLSDEGLRQGSDNMKSLMDNLEQLSLSIERLHTANSTPDTS